MPKKKQKKSLDSGAVIVERLRHVVEVIPGQEMPSKLQHAWSFAKSILIAVVLAFTFRSCLYEPFHIPSGSMKPTLVVGDYIFVTKYAYGYSRYSFPFGFPLFEGRLFFTAPKRGDVAVFRLPSDPSVNYIKRLVGLPGDRIQISDGELYVNGRRMKREYVGEVTEVVAEDYSQPVTHYREVVSGGVAYDVWDAKTISMDNTREYRVPEGKYFFMGDNRDDSTDSRFSDVGMIPEDHLVGRADVIVFSAKHPYWQVWEWFVSLAPERREP